MDHTKASELVEITINNYPATFTTKDGLSQVIWSDSNRLILVTTRLSKEETIRIANNIKNKKVSKTVSFS
ncbi:MAG TPA: DUF4367 domain-containing protein [Tissierellia bacterium]|nr:DUF4367 domain-containing protein [Tissierellia bacterium]